MFTWWCARAKFRFTLHWHIMTTVIASCSFRKDVGVVAWTWFIILNPCVFTIRYLWGEYAVCALRGKLLAFLNNGWLVIASWARDITRWVKLVLDIDAWFEEFAHYLRGLEVANLSPFLVSMNVGVVKCRSYCVLLLPSRWVCLHFTSVHVGIYFLGWDRSCLWLDLVNLWLVGRG